MSGEFELAVQAGFVQTQQDLDYEVTGGAVVSAVGGVGPPRPRMETASAARLFQV